MKKIYRILGQKGRTTIPYAIRVKLGLQAEDLLSFTESKDGKSIIIHKEKVCDGCKTNKTYTKPQPKKSDEEITLYDFLNGLSPEQQRAALVHLSVKWAAAQGGVGNIGA
jgi:bifunctional DNA-binding transcriptional regulator/antitoxin component of YhaV-PrlF toxin-antitoxin module